MKAPVPEFTVHRAATRAIHSQRIWAKFAERREARRAATTRRRVRKQSDNVERRVVGRVWTNGGRSSLLPMSAMPRAAIVPGLRKKPQRAAG
jgi:hypothetical protein